MIGTQDNAEVAVLLCDTTYGDKMPNGWEILGSGIDRTAYLGPDTVVYKITHRLTRYEANEREFDACRILGSSPAPEGFGVPKASLFTVDDTKVIAMEFLGDEDYSVNLTRDQKNIANVFYRNTDTHVGNMRKVNDIIYMIDIAFFQERDSDGDDNGCSCADCR